MGNYNFNKFNAVLDSFKTLFVENEWTVLCEASSSIQVFPNFSIFSLCLLNFPLSVEHSGFPSSGATAQVHI